MGWMDSDVDYINQIAQAENTTYAKLQVQETLGLRNLKKEVEELKEKAKNFNKNSDN